VSTRGRIVTFGRSVSTCLRKYADFSGRAGRSEYWWFFLFSAVIGVVGFGLVAVAIWGVEPALDIVVFVVAGMMLFALVLPGLAAAVRRLHDTDRSGACYLMVLIPGIGGIVLLLLLVQPGTTGPNRFGPPPE
jgi:uncharacterized membrane protein YhaH (DUF805 family)